MIDYTSATIILGFLLDLAFGDPHWLYHPVRLVGLLISFLERFLRKIFPKTRTAEYIAGTVLAVLTAIITALATWFIIHMCGHGPLLFSFIARTLICYSLLASRSLSDESMKVYSKLIENDLDSARRALSMIVGRDTQNLTKEGIAKAAVETVAENTSDAVIAPLFYLAIGGPVLGWIYKSVNTMDSMIGYKNNIYRYFGTAAAKLDDAMNFIPSRLSALLMIISSIWLHLDAGKAWKIWLRDRLNHASPNSAQTESVMAGALGVQLAGDASYFGKLVHKKTIGDDTRQIVPGDIPRSCSVMYASSILALILFIFVRCILLAAI